MFLLAEEGRGKTILSATEPFQSSLLRGGRQLKAVRLQNQRAPLRCKARALQGFGRHGYLGFTPYLRHYLATEFGRPGRIMRDRRRRVLAPRLAL